MGGKAKPTKHTAKEINNKIKEASQNKGGGKDGLKDRQGGAAGHAKFKCPLCGIQSPSIKSAEEHWDSKHSKLPFDPASWCDTHEANGGVTTKGVAVKGSAKTKTQHELTKSKSGQAQLEQQKKEKMKALESL